MPNHIQNRITIIGNDKEVAKVLTHIKNGTETQIDFNKIKKMPESLNIESGSKGELAHDLLFGTVADKLFPRDTKEKQNRFSKMVIERQKEAVDLAFQYQFNLENYGHTTWYGWALENWGTKWNAYGQNDQRTKDNVIYFQTACSSPIDLISELSKQFPTVEILLDYADEDSGSNTGKIIFKAGSELERFNPESQSKESYDIYFELNPDRLSDYKLVDNKYEYVEEE
jgi:hypothetical protein